MLPDELKARMENVRGQRRELNLLWAKAVASRGDKSVADTRADFNRVNAAAIAKLSADEQTLREDIAAIRDGYAGEGREDVPMSRFGAVKDDSGPGPMDEMPGPPEGNLRKVIEAEIVARIGALKEPLTADSYSKIVREVFSSHRREFVESMRNRQGPGMGPMAPDLARMRDAMNHMRDASWGEKREFRSELRAAMKIQDQQAREAAVRQILDKYAVDSDESKDAPPAPEKTR
ncbi:MAG TPA: hypothetical protein PKI32_08775, partial [Opitutales bacterium]|nr:hypothetical protein [Opitutales bacterium]